MRLLIQGVSVVAWLLIGLVVSACVAPKPSTLSSPVSPPPTPSVQSTATKPTIAATSPLATPLPFASVAGIRDLTFVDPQYGWLLAAVCGADHICPMVIHATQDGGQSWQAMNAPTAEAIFSEGNLSDTKRVDELRFATTDVGWAFNPDFFSTRDGGKTWTNEQRAVVALELIGQTVWAIEKQGHSLIVVTSDDLGRTWKPTAGQPELHDQVSVAGAGARHVWVLAVQEESRLAQLFTTGDGGVAWQRQLLPTQVGGCTSLVLAVSSDQKLWLLCGDGLATAMQPKWLYASIDSGASWNLVSSADVAAESIGRLPISGHIFDSRGFAVTSPTTAFMALNRGTLYVTRDGGKNWNDVVTDQPVNLGDAAIGPLHFIDTAHGWLVSAGRVFRTTDGGITWQISTIN